MIRTLAGLASVSAALLFASTAISDDLDVEGQVESLNAAEQTLVVAGHTYRTDDRTDYDDDLVRFEDLRVGDRVEIDYAVVDGQRVAREIEKDD